MPSFNQAQYLETALRSILDQDYAGVQCVVMDGGSTDGSVEILQRYDSRLTAWVSAPDKGSYSAVNKAIAATNSEIIGWMNSDDAYVPGAFAIAGDIFARFPEIDWITTLFPLHMDEHGRTVRADLARGFNREGFLSGEYLPEPGAFSLGYVQQESTFWRRSLWEKAGGQIDPEFPLAGDFALWAQFFEHAELFGVAAPLAAFRIHGEQRIALRLEAYNEECRKVLVKYGGGRKEGVHRAFREIATRAPVAGHALLEKVGAMRRARAVRWDLMSGAWKLEEYFI